MMDEYPVCAYCAGPLLPGNAVYCGVQVCRDCATHVDRSNSHWIDLVIEAAMSGIDAELAFLLG